MGKDDGGDSPTVPQKTNVDVEEDDTTVSEGSDDDRVEKRSEKASKGRNKGRQAHNPYDTNKGGANGPSVSVASRSKTKGEESTSPSITTPCSISPHPFSSSKVCSVCPPRKAEK